MEKISKTDLVKMLKANPSATFASIVVCKEEKLKKNCPWQVKSYRHVNSNFNNNYERKVQKVTGDSTFKAQPRKWGKKLTNSLVEHKGYFYVQILEPKHENVYLADNRIVSSSTLDRYRYARNNDGPVKVVTYKIEDILYVKIFGQQFEVI